MAGPGRHDVSSHMVKWWKGYRHNDGQVTRHLSPFEQAAIVPWFRTFPKRAYDKFTDAAVYWGLTGIAVIGVTVLADEADAAEDRTHRY
eukprot:CAMPEP_0198253552 /NCGR_PEP_ID=MMETSP1447-20131203/3960_1 /TAXON_ID=420782 /ORGANISM="Chaetoceros dichaeta, Strain CCMP1751" /LENGTH=88 /DNA_ID=CAMNT_0043939271 /DNA_START=80 /DNA_END=346 /DNA_ORIENTATION=-